MSLLVKICGINSTDAMDAALAEGADMVGLNFFEKSPRNLKLAQAEALAARARGRAEIVAVLVDEDDKVIDAIVRALRPDWLQLHGRESAERVAHIFRTFGVKVMKALGVATAADLEGAARYAGVERLLLDSKAPISAPLPGGNGLPFDWRLLEQSAVPRPFLLSGGLTPQNVGDAIALCGASDAFLGVDVSSGVERAPGVKDPAAIASFIRAARATTPDYVA